MSGDLFSRIKDPLQIEAMSVSQLCYWHQWHEKMNEAEEAAIEKQRLENRNA